MSPKKGLMRNLVAFSNFITEKTGEVLKDFDISYQDFLILSFINDFEGTTQYEISKNIGISLQRCNQIVKSLEVRNLIRKDCNLRGKLLKKNLFLTEKGTEFRETISEKVLIHLSKLDFPNDDLIILNLTLKRLNSFIEEKKIADYLSKAVSYFYSSRNIFKISSSLL